MPAGQQKLAAAVVRALALAPNEDIPSGLNQLPLYFKDDTTTRLVNELARRRGLTKQGAVRLAVEAELVREEKTVPLRDRLIRLWEANPLPPRTAQVADKAFFDELSSEP